MIILVVNAGSSSLKYQLIDMKDESVIAKGNCDRIGIDGHLSHKTADGRKVEEDCNFPTHAEAFERLVQALTTGDAAVISSMDEVSAVGHRVVQGAELFTKTTLVTDEVIDEIENLKELAPVHNHGHALALWACKKTMPNIPQVVVFDTAFHQTIPQKAFMYGFPYEDYEQYHVRKYGFHGTSHRFVTAKLAEVMGKDLKDLKVVSCHLVGARLAQVCAMLRDGEQEPEQEETGGFGLFNVNQRIQLNYGREYGLKIQSTYGQGTEIWVRIPCRAEKIKRKRNISKKITPFEENTAKL